MHQDALKGELDLHPSCLWSKKIINSVWGGEWFSTIQCKLVFNQFRLRTV